MYIIKHTLSHIKYCGKMLFWPLVLLCCFTWPARADVLDAYNLAPFVPLVLESMMNIATSLYNFFVGKGTGVIYLLVYGFAAVYISLYLIKMFLPKDWLSFIGFSGGGEMWDKTPDPFKISESVLKPALRVVIACVVLLQIKPVYVTEWLVNPFLQVGSFYTENILSTITNAPVDEINVPSCPDSIVRSGWLSKDSCNFLVQPVYTISNENNRVIKYGFSFLTKGLKGLMTLIPHGGQDILNIITGILLISAFVASNAFMALLIIQGIFEFCFALIMYPFNVLAWVAKKSDKWFDVLPVFSQIIESLKKLVIIMISCAFILCVNIAVVRALFNWSSSVFVTASNGMAYSNVPTITNTAMGFGQHSMLWITSVLTLFLMQNIFKMTRERLDVYTGTKDSSNWLYKNATNDAKIGWGKITSAHGTAKDIIGGIKKITKK